MKKIDSFTLRGSMGTTIKATICQDGSEYVLNAGHLARDKRFGSLDELYGYCSGRGWDLKRKAKKSPEALKRQPAAVKEEFRQKMLKEGLLTKDGREIRIFR